MTKKLFILFLFLQFFSKNQAQGVFPIYTDYLSDNIFLIHASAAGIGNCAKLRLTYRQQWMEISDAPSLQTLSFHSKISEKAAVGGILYNDENGYHSQKGFAGSFAYHLNFGMEEALNQLSFGISFMYIQNSIDQRSFTSQIPDPIITQIVESNSYYSADFSLAYHFLDTFSYLTIKNLFLNSNENDQTTFSTLNLRRYLLTFGNYFGRGDDFQFEPSIMGQYIERTGELFVDFNFKTYKIFKDNKQLWAAISYRQNFEKNTMESLRQITPILGFDYKIFMFSYTYTHQIGDITFDNGGFHQITIGINMLCKKQRATGCPNVNSVY